jgi:hypothetical protein
MQYYAKPVARSSYDRLYDEVGFLPFLLIGIVAVELNREFPLGFEMMVDVLFEAVLT